MTTGMPLLVDSGYMPCTMATVSRCPEARHYQLTWAGDKNDKKEAL